MMKRLCSGTILSAFFLCSLVVGTYADEAKSHITIAIFPCTDAVMVFKRFRPLITYLEQETGFDIDIVVPTDPTEFEMGLKNGDVHFAFQNARTYAELAGLYDRGALLRALTRKGAAVQSGLVIVKKGSGIEKIADLRDKVVLFGPKNSTTRWFGAKLLFEENGIDIDEDLKGYSHGLSCEGMAFSVQYGGVDAAVVCEHFFEEYSEKQKQLGVQPELFLVIDRTKLFPTWVFAPRRGIGSDIINKVNQALLRLDRKIPVHDKILRDAELGGFEKAKDEDYNDTRRQLKGGRPLFHTWSQNLLQYCWVY
jgi:phosphonate transport system substrate-binding protein